MTGQTSLVEAERPSVVDRAALVITDPRRSLA